MKKTIPGLRLAKLRSFTLIELLVVIAIIAILAGIIMQAATYAIKAAQRAKAFNMATQIQSGVIGYYTEYSVYPIPAASVTTPATDYLITDLTGSKTQWQSLIYCLAGNNHPSTGLTTPAPGTVTANTRGISYLSLKASDVDANDAPKNPLPTGLEIYFNLAMDTDYSGELGDTSSTPPSVALPNFAASPFTGAAVTTGGITSAGCAVWANCNGSSSSTNAGSYVHTY